MEIKKMNYLTIKEIASQWNVGTTTVTRYCIEGRIPGAKKEDRRWKIPDDAQKPNTDRGICKKYNFTFIDLFAGVGGFHQAMSAFGGKCVFASEIDPYCQKTYKGQFGVDVYGDINLYYDKIPQFDVLCGGFPCQTFSKAGNQEGFENEEKGKLFFKIVDILKLHPECKFIILENVRNLADDEKFWNVIQRELKELNFFITQEPVIKSPDFFGIPQNRERVYILGIKKELRDQAKLTNGWIHLDDLKLDQYKRACVDGTAFEILDKNYEKNADYMISDEEARIIDLWEEFKRDILPDKQIGTPIWLDYFGIGLGADQTESFYQSNGYYTQRVKARKKDYEDPEIRDLIDQDGYYIQETPKWKKGFIRKNREFYISRKAKIDVWYAKYQHLLTKKTYRKFEWNCGPKYKDFKTCILQFRQSGLRIKKADTFPSLVAIVNTPIIYDDVLGSYRRITVREAANLQSFKQDYKFVCEDSESYKQLGNSVNVRVIELIAQQLFALGIDGWDEACDVRE